MDEQTQNHICLRAQCGICFRAVEADDDFVPLYGEGADAAPSLTWTLEATLKLTDIPSEALLVTGDRLCWMPRCRTCVNASEAVGIHATCLELFKRECLIEDAMMRLTVTVLAQSPWKDAQNLRLDIKDKWSPHAVREMAPRIGMPKLASLPPEIIGLIEEVSDHAMFWAYVSVITFARWLSGAPTGDVPRIPTSNSNLALCNIKSWSRGEEPIVSPDPLDDLPFILLTYDFRGLEQIQRLQTRPKRPKRRALTSTDRAFSVYQQSELQDVTAHAQYGFVRLQLPRRLPGLHIWDIPGPPVISQFNVVGHIPESTRFRTIKLRGITGLTFFFYFGRVHGIHAHTPQEPCAMTTRERLAGREQMIWSYVPIGKTDEIIALALRLRVTQGRYTAQKPCFLIRFKLAGDFHVGPSRVGEGETQDLGLSRAPPKLLIYNTPGHDAATLYGTYPKDETNYPIRRFAPDRFVRGSLGHAISSWAPIVNVERMHIFTDDRSIWCKGIVFEYRDGAQRAIGECRLGVHKVKTVSEPTRLCYLVEDEPGQRYRSWPSRQFAIEAHQNIEHQHQHEGHWDCLELEGGIDLFCQADKTILNIPVIPALGHIPFE